MEVVGAPWTLQVLVRGWCSVDVAGAPWAWLRFPRIWARMEPWRPHSCPILLFLGTPGASPGPGAHRFFGFAVVIHLFFFSKAILKTKQEHIYIHVSGLLGALNWQLSNTGAG